MVSVAFAKYYAYCYWSILGVALAFLAPCIPNWAGPNSPVGLDLLSEEPSPAVFILAHCWGLMMLSTIAANMLTPGHDLLFVRIMAISTSVSSLPVAQFVDGGFSSVRSWCVFVYGAVHVANIYIHVSAGFFSEEAKKLSHQRYVSLPTTCTKYEEA